MPSIEELARKHGYPYTPLQTRVNDTQIDIVPVKHVKKFYRDNRHFFNNSLSQSKAAAIESISEMFDPYLDDNDGAIFFRKIAKACVEEDMPVFDFDSGFNIASQISPASRLAGIAAYITGAVIGLGAGVSLAALNCSGDVVVTGTLLAAAGTGLYACAHAEQTEKKIEGVYDSSLLVRYDSVLDFRDIRSALGIHALTQADNAPDQITLYYGSNHARGIKNYIDHPRLLMKRFLYPILNAKAPFVFREFHRSEKNPENPFNEWSLMGLHPYKDMPYDLSLARTDLGRTA